MLRYWTVQIKIELFLWIQHKMLEMTFFFYQTTFFRFDCAKPSALKRHKLFKPNTQNNNSNNIGLQVRISYFSKNKETPRRTAIKLKCWFFSIVFIRQYSKALVEATTAWRIVYTHKYTKLKYFEKYCKFYRWTERKSLVRTESEKKFHHKNHWENKTIFLTRRCFFMVCPKAWISRSFYYVSFPISYSAYIY